MIGRRRWRRWFAWSAAAVVALFVAGVLLGLPVAWPFDVVLNLGAVVDRPDSRAPNDGKVRVVVLQHGLFRTSASLARLARSLEHHGYEVLNPGYPSTRERLDASAARLHHAIAARQTQGRVDEWAFVAHSMGGLVVQDYLRRPDAVAPRACVYIGTPHHGAILADLRRHWFVFRWTMGTAAAYELSPGDLRHQLPTPWLDRSGAIAGDLGDGNATIPGNDDGTVGVAEAQLPGAAGALCVPFGHTRLTVAPLVIEQTLHFLAKGAFATSPGKQ
jgi:triacylglycerol lipase